MEQSKLKIRFPFVVARRKAVVIEAATLDNAIDRVAAKYPNKWIKTTHARNIIKHKRTMDLINAQKEAKAKSKATKGTLFHIILVDDEFEIRDYKTIGDKDDIYSTWRDGIKIDEPEGKKPEPEVEQPKANKQKKFSEKKLKKEFETKEVEEPKNETTMKTKTKKSKKTAPKKVAKKVAAKKNGKKIERKPFTPGKVVNISIADMIAKCKKGFYYRDHLGRLQSVDYMKTRAKQDYVREGMHEYKKGA